MTTSRRDWGSEIEQRRHMQDAKLPKDSAWRTFVGCSVSVSELPTSSIAADGAATMPRTEAGTADVTHKIEAHTAQHHPLLSPLAHLRLRPLFG
jgi:hypothetical protein